jgi:hypothetical protein
MPDNQPNRTAESLIRHTAGFVEGDTGIDTTSSMTAETTHGEDWMTTSNIINDLVGAGFDIETANRILAPRVVAGIKSEREYRRECHQRLKEIGYNAGRNLYSGVVNHEDAAGLLERFIEADAAGVGVELGHIELFGHKLVLGALSVDQAWKQLDNMGEKIASTLGYEVVDAHEIPASHRPAVFTGEYRAASGVTEKIRLPRARSNSPVLDIGQTGVQLFVRVAVGYDTADSDEDRIVPTLHEIRDMHTRYMEAHTGDKGITKLDEKAFAYPIAGTLVAYKRNPAA